MEPLDAIFKVRKNLFIGAYWPRINFKILKQEGIIAIVNLMVENLYTPPSSYKYLHRGFPDGTYPPHVYIEEILKFIDKHIPKGGVLVHCAMGISRSGGLICAWLLKQNPDWSWTNAMEFVRQNRMIYPAVEIRKSVLDYLEAIESKRRRI